MDEKSAAAAQRIRALASRPNLNPLVADVIGIIADVVGGEWITDDRTAEMEMKARKLIVNDTETAQVNERVNAAERKAAEADGQLQSVLSSEQQSRLLRELSDMREQNAALLNVKADSMAELFEARVSNLADENAQLSRRVRELENQVIELRKELLKAGATSNGSQSAAAPNAGASNLAASSLRERSRM